ncbi:MAG TPA: CRISPR-associated protein, partial [Porphyromonadaceae bacterium]|nr:CRISPR-associated protein [Porphyromonadaceae bacterium]
MCNSFNSIRQIISNNQSILSKLKDKENYYAHIREGRKNESLEEHQHLVNDYFCAVCDHLQLDDVINSIIQRFTDNCFSGQCSPELKNSIKELFCDTIIFHDFGKVNENFQAAPDKMNNSLFRMLESPISTNHSLLSEYLFIAYHLNKIPFIAKNNLDQFLLMYCVFAFSYPIAKHHASQLNNTFQEINFKTDLLEFINRYLKLFSWEIQEPFKTKILEKEMLKSKLFDNLSEFYAGCKEEFSFFALIKLCYSLLTASDYLATMHYMNGWQKMYSDFGILDEELKKRIIYNIHTSQDYNKRVYDNLDTYKLLCPQEKNNDNLNRLRSEMAVEVIRNIRLNFDKRLFYIEAPTGGGKTNLSMIALSELLEQDLSTKKNSINKVFYVFPFTTLITQTYTVLQKTLGLNEDEIIELHSRAELKEKSNDGEYGKNKKCYLDGLFVNYPVILTSHVHFFDLLKTCRKETNYLLHRLANSVIIIDELQSYPPEQWDKIIYLIDHYAELFNMKFILMSATLPKIGKLTWSEKVPDFTYLIRDKNIYFQNENFKGRVLFDFSVFRDWKKPAKGNKEEKTAYLSQLCEKLFEESGVYQQKNGKVFTIIEFIFKRTAAEFYSIANNVNSDTFDHIFLLSGTILEPRKKEIISFLKNPDNGDKKVLLITTQVVEAGVDIDMDLGFKDASLVDSDEQLA